MKTFLIEHNRKKKSYIVLLEEDGILRYVRRMSNGDKFIGKAFFTDNYELEYRNQVYDYEDEKVYFSKLDEINSMALFSDNKFTILNRHKKSIVEKR